MGEVAKGCLRVRILFFIVAGLAGGISEGRRAAATDSSWAQRIRDPVHGLVVFGDGGDPDRDKTDRIAWNLLNTPESQRLRRIRRLGFSDLVFPGATRSRFAHRIGAHHMARWLAEVSA